MPPNRRSFLTTVAAGLGTVAGLTVLHQTLAPRPNDPLRRGAFSPVVGSSFLISDGSTAARVVLASVSDLTGVPPGSDRAFSLLFEPTSGPRLEQRIYSVATDGVAPVKLFLAPVDRGTALRYQAIINQFSAEELQK